MAMNPTNVFDLMKPAQGGGFNRGLANGYAMGTMNNRFSAPMDLMDQILARSQKGYDTQLALDADAVKTAADLGLKNSVLSRFAANMGDKYSMLPGDDGPTEIDYGTYVKDANGVEQFKPGSGQAQYTTWEAFDTPAGKMYRQVKKFLSPPAFNQAVMNPQTAEFQKQEYDRLHPRAGVPAAQASSQQTIDDLINRVSQKLGN